MKRKRRKGKLIICWVGGGGKLQGYRRVFGSISIIILRANMHYLTIIHSLLFRGWEGFFFSPHFFQIIDKISTLKNKDKNNEKSLIDKVGYDISCTLINALAGNNVLIQHTSRENYVVKPHTG